MSSSPPSHTCARLLTRTSKGLPPCFLKLLPLITSADRYNRAYSSHTLALSPGVYEISRSDFFFFFFSPSSIRAFSAPPPTFSPLRPYVRAPELRMCTRLTLKCTAWEKKCTRACPSFGSCESDMWSPAGAAAERRILTSHGLVISTHTHTVRTLGEADKERKVQDGKEQWSEQVTWTFYTWKVRILKKLYAKILFENSRVWMNISVFVLLFTDID